jgi:acetyl esterase/lipase
MKARSVFHIFTALTAAAIITTSALAQTPMPDSGKQPAPLPQGILLYGAPKAGALPEQVIGTRSLRIVRNVVDPTLTPFLPDPAKATGAAVIVAPGGGFVILSIDNEGYKVAQWLSDHGVAAFVLKYRTRETNRGPAANAANTRKMSQGGTTSANNVLETPDASMADAEAAVRMVRSRAAEWNIDPKRVGFVGFSAGAMLALDIGFDQDTSVRPDFIAPIYGPFGPRDVPADAPPMFAAIAVDDPVLGKTNLELILAYRAAHRPVEFHWYEKGGHGFGMQPKGTTSDMWIDEFYTWMRDRGELTAK